MTRRKTRAVGLHADDGGAPSTATHIWTRTPAPKTVGECRGGDYVVVDGRQLGRLSWKSDRQSAVRIYDVTVTWGVPGIRMSKRRGVEFWDNGTPVLAVALMP